MQYLSEDEAKLIMFLYVVSYKANSGNECNSNKNAMINSGRTNIIIDAPSC